MKFEDILRYLATSAGPAWWSRPIIPSYRDDSYFPAVGILYADYVYALKVPLGKRRRG